MRIRIGGANLREPGVSRMLDARQLVITLFSFLIMKNAGSPKNEKNAQRLEANVPVNLPSFIGTSLALFFYGKMF
ncbi:MAG TPA: hypothetical protein VGW77_19200 [Candidatus Binatia bacterium]|nr:hypothetical protein [Candidatus Binatia bacterium]